MTAEVETVTIPPHVGEVGGCEPDAIAVGSIVWSTRARTTDGVPTEGGMVVEVGVYEDTGAPYVIVLDEGVPRCRMQVKYDGAKGWKSLRPAGTRRIDLADVDPGTIEAPSVPRMQGWARKALLGDVVMPGEAFALVVVAGTLLQAAEALSQSERAKTQAKVDDFNAELEERRAQRERAS